MSSTTPLATYRYRRRLPHLQRADADLFVTFCTARFHLTDAARDLVLEHCLREDVASVARAPSHANCPQPRIKLWAAAIMPDHVHLLLAAWRDENGWPFRLVEIMQSLKARLPIVLTNSFTDPAQSGKRNHSITCCGQKKA